MSLGFVKGLVFAKPSTPSKLIKETVYSVFVYLLIANIIHTFMFLLL